MLTLGLRLELSVSGLLAIDEVHEAVFRNGVEAALAVPKKDNVSVEHFSLSEEMGWVSHLLGVALLLCFMTDAARALV